MKNHYKKLFNELDGNTKNIYSRELNSRVLIVDGMNTFIRCWSVIPSMNDDGEHSGGVSGTLKSIGYAIKEVNPTRVIVVFDGSGGSQQRKKIYSGYKSDRHKNKLRVNRQYDDLMTEEDERESMKRQFVWLFEMLNTLPVTHMIYDGVEADDVMSYIATDLIAENEQAVIMSSDKDFLQLINDRVTVWSPTKKKLYTRTEIKEEYGIIPENILTYRVLDGDKSDTIPGIKGCGLKTLIKRFPEFAEDKPLSINQLIDLAEQKRVDSKIKLYDTIVKSKETILLNYELMNLKSGNFSGIIRVQIQDRFNLIPNSLNKTAFLKVCMKYKIEHNFGKNVINWLNTTFGQLVTK